MMTGLEICALIMTTIRDGITSNWFTETFRVGKAFSRTRKLSMSLVMMFLLSKTNPHAASGTTINETVICKCGKEVYNDRCGKADDFLGL